MRLLKRIGVRCTAVALVIAFAGLSRPHASAQSRGDDMDALATAAKKAYSEHDWNTAAAKYGSMRDLGHERGDELWEARGLLGVGSVSYELGRNDDARPALLAALSMFERLHATAFIGLANDTLGRVALAAGDNQESIARTSRAMEVFQRTGDRHAHAVAALRLLTADQLRDRDALDRAFEAVLQETRSVGDALLEGRTLHHWGDQLFIIADYDAAIEKLAAAAELFEKAGDPESLATVYTSLGRLYRVHGQPQAAVSYQLKSLALAERSHSPFAYTQSLNAVGVAYQAAGDSPRARDYFERALASAEKDGSDRMIEFIRANLGALYLEIGEPQRARAVLEEITTRGTETHLPMRFDQLSRVYYNLGRFDDARAAAQQSLDLCKDETPLECLFARLHLAEADLGLHDETAAVDNYQTVLKEVETIHGKLAAIDFLKQEFYHFWEFLYSFGIELHVRRGEFREALETAELARSRAFLDLLASRDIHPDTQALPRMTALTTRGAAMTLRSTAVAGAPDAGELAAIAARLDSTLLVYWVASDRLYTWVVSAQGVVRATTSRTTSIRLAELIRSTSPFEPPPEGQIEPVATTATRGDRPIALTMRRNPAWRELYDLLIKPVEPDLPRAAGARITIVPHGPLLQLPFAALRDARGRYLIERYSIHSVPAAAVLQFTGGRVRSNARSGRLLVVADPAATPRVAGEPPLPRLPGAVEEARAIARLVPAARTMLLTGANATEARVRDALAQRAVIHFATHALVRDTDPLSSFLALGSGNNRDGKLTAEEIYRLKLDADLIVLSACRSGSGLVSGDGIAGLARAFFYAGAPSLVVSLWDVADAPTSRLLPAFYRAWLGGMDKDRALRAAQIALIRSLREQRVRVSTSAGEIAIPEDPAFWAGFVLLGEPE